MAGVQPSARARASGRLDQRITFQVLTDVPDGYGGFGRTWADISTTPTVWARVVPMTAGEAVTAQAQRGVAAFRIYIRHRTDVTDQMRIVWGSRTLNVRLAEDPTQERRELMIYAEEGALDD